jgi:UDP-glucose:(heptosyl)LPS alpha-1,3-glucosyltransferase
MEDELFRQRRFRRLIALTPTVQRDLERFYGVDAGDVDVLPNGFSPVEFNPGLRSEYGSSLRRSCGIPEDAWVVLFVANEWERKGLVPLMEAVASLHDSRVHLVAVGRLPKAGVVARAQQLGISGRVHVVGPTGRVNRWFGIADAFALPSVYEAWGMVIIEALAAGVPVLTSRCAGAAVAVKEAVNGHLLEDPTDVSQIRLGLRLLREGAHGSPQEISRSVSGFEWGCVLGRYEQILRAHS